MPSMLALEKAKVRKVNRAREARDQKGARIRAQKGTRVSLGATPKVAGALCPPKVPNLALCRIVVYMLTHHIAIAGLLFREVCHRVIC